MDADNPSPPPRRSPPDRDASRQDHADAEASATSSSSDDPSARITGWSDDAGAGIDPAHPVRFDWAHLQILEEIGRGGFGRVYRAWDPTLARDVALKLVEVLPGEREGAAEVLREGRMLARVRHPNVVMVYGAQLVGRQIGIWMELVRGRSLAAVVQKDGPLGPDEATVVGVSVCRALAAVHTAGLLHRDLKAHNVMREAGGRIVLMDFGAGRDVSLAETGPLSYTPGTPLYMAPEVVTGRPATQASDIYSLGVLLYFLVTGTYPIVGRTLPDIVMAHGLRHRRFITDVRPDLPERFVRVVERALSTSPEDRYQSAGSMLQDLTAEGGPQLPALIDPGAVVGGAADAPYTPRRSRSPARVTPRPRLRSPRPRPRPPFWQRPGGAPAAAAGALALVAFAGFVASMALNVTLGRPAAFVQESPLAWPVWGIRALIAPAVYMTAAVMLVLVARSLWRFACRLSSPLARLAGQLRVRVSALLDRLALSDATVAAQVLFVVQLALAGLVCWRFWPLLSAFTVEASTAPRAQLALLGAEHKPTHVMYGLALDMLIIGMASAWYALVVIRRRRSLPAVDVTAAAGIGVTALLALLLVAPYRILWHNEFERVTFAGDRCYQTGERAEEILLYCPDADPPRNRVVGRDDERLRRLHLVEGVFTSNPAPGDR